MKYVKQYRCTLCNKIYPPRELLTCPECGDLGILDIEYDYKAMKTEVNEAYFKNILPDSIWRYRAFLSIPIDPFQVSLKVGLTPLYKSENLNKHLNLKALYIKDDGMNPTGSLKDRASLIACIDAYHKGAEILSCSSTGNAASSLAGNAAKLNLKTVIFVPKRAPSGKVAQLMVYGANVIRVNGDYKKTFNLSKEAIDTFGWYNRNAAINPHCVEGKKTVALEIAEQLKFKVPDWVAVSVGDGCTIAAVYKGFYDLLQLDLIEKIPRLLGVQSEGCSPFVDAYLNNTKLEETEENTLADSIAVGIPRNPVKAVRAVKESEGAWIKVSDQAILDAMTLLGETEGIFSEPASSAGLAGLIKAINNNIIKESESVVFINTGNGLKDLNSANLATGESVIIDPSLDALKKHLNQREEN